MTLSPSLQLGSSDRQGKLKCSRRRRAAYSSPQANTWIAPSLPADIKVIAEKSEFLRADNGANEGIRGARSAAATPMKQTDLTVLNEPANRGGAAALQSL